MSHGDRDTEEPQSPRAQAKLGAPSPATFGFAQTRASQGSLYWTVLDSGHAIVDSADGYLRFLRFGLGAEESLTKQYARNLAYFCTWIAARELDLTSAADVLEEFSAHLRSGAATGGEDFLIHRPERIAQVLAAVRGLYLHLVERQELPLAVLGGLDRLVELRDLGVSSYAQNGEDLQIAYYVGHERITYIDVGCLWPKEHSNSYFFYRRGGSGLCIDANPTIAEEYRRERPRDLFLSSGIGASDSTMTYYTHSNPVFNTFSSTHADELAARVARMDDSPQRAGRERTGAIAVPVTTLDRAVRSTGFLERCGEHVDFLSIDVEGLELEVLQGFSFHAPRPRLVVVEEVRRGSRVRLAPEDLPIARLLEANHYWLAGRSGVNLYFLDEGVER